MTKLGYAVQKPKQCKTVAGKRVCGLKEKKIQNWKIYFCTT